MEVTFDSGDLDRLETDLAFTAGLPLSVVKMYRKRLHTIRYAPDERDFYQLQSLRFEKLKGSRQHQRSMRLNGQWRLILEIRELSESKQVVIVGIEDYH